MPTTTDVDLRPYLIGNTDRCRVYRFPNGHTASVHSAGAGRFLVECEALDGDTMVPLAPDGVNGLLADIYRMPGN